MVWHQTAQCILLHISDFAQARAMLDVFFLAEYLTVNCIIGNAVSEIK